MRKFVEYGAEFEHAEKLKDGLAKLGPDFTATLCYWCDGRTIRNFETCNVCGLHKGYAMALGLLWKADLSPASESVVNQVLVAAERKTMEPATP